jgi:hypothetical protein
VLLIKIRLDIRRPVMRGVTIDVGEGEEVKPLWCPLCYEFLPDFCYTCGLIGHTDRMCEKKLEKGQVQQYSRSLRFIPEKKLSFGGRGSSSGEKGVHRLRRSGEKDAGGGSWGSRGSGSPKRSDVASWRETLVQSEAEGEGDEVTSPLKIKESVQTSGEAKRALEFDTGKGKEMVLEMSGLIDESGRKRGAEGKVEDKHLKSVMHMEEALKQPTLLKGEVDPPKKNHKTFKRLPRSPSTIVAPMLVNHQEGKKRVRGEDEAMEVEEDKRAKYGRDDIGDAQTHEEAEPADRLCGKK